MSLLDTASLIVTPNGYKEGKLYSVIPSDGSGDMSVVRATTATRVNSAGLVELVPYNLLQYSEDFSNAAWIKTDVTITSNAITAPNGTLTADKVSSSVNGTLAVYVDQYVNGATPINVTHTYSVYAKAGEVTQMLFYLGYQNGIYFNLTTGQFISYWSGAQDIIAYSSTNVGNGWFKYDITLSSNDGTLLILFPAQGGNISFAQTIGNGFYIWGAQLNEGTAKDYQKTETRLNIPRLDYSNGTCPSLLVEPQRTNDALYSQELDNAYWLKFLCSITANQGISPDGTQNADLMTSSGANSVLYRSGISCRVLSYFAKAVSLSSASKFSISVDGVGFAKWNQDGTLSSVSGGTATDGQNMGNGWFRFTYVVTSGSVANYGLSDNSSTSTALFWGLQAEAGNYSTSYIPTTSASVTRNADVISKTGISSLIGQTEGTLFVDFVCNGFADFGTPLCINDGSTANSIWITTFGNGDIRGEVFGSSNVQASFTLSGGVVGQRYKLALVYKANDFAMYVNGNLIGTDLSGTLPINLSRVDFDYANAPLFVKSALEINAAALWKTRLTNTQLAQLTTI
jgi:hypothetical protein